MPADKVGFLITTTPGDWSDYDKAFTNVWETTLKHPSNSIKKLPSGGAHGVDKAIRGAAQAFEIDNDVGVIVTAGTGAALICKEELTKPFVYASVGDPVLSNLQPGVDGHNFTGGNNQQADQTAVQARVDYMLNHGFQEPFMVIGNNDKKREPFETAMNNALTYLRSPRWGKAAELKTITPNDNIPQFIVDLKNQGFKSIYVCSDPYLTVNSKALNDAAHDIHNGPYINTMFEIKEHTNKQHGGNAWYGSDFDQLFATAAFYAHDIITKTNTPDQLLIYTTPLSGGGAAK